MQHVMVDIETSGTRSDRHAILQIAAWKFDLKNMTIDPNPFDRCLSIPPTRFWDEGTRVWWQNQKGHILEEIQARAEDPKIVIDDLVKWVAGDRLAFWGKPSHFDYNFVNGYIADFGYPSIFHYRKVTDMNSWIGARYFPDPAPQLEVQFDGDVHNALFDSLHQVQVLFAHYENTRRDSNV